MKKNTIFPNLIQKFVSPEELDFLGKAVGYKDVARKMDVMTLIQYLVTAAACESENNIRILCTSVTRFT